MGTGSRPSVTPALRRGWLVLLPVSLLLAMLGAGPAHAAGWSRAKSAGPATLTMAKLARSFVPISTPATGAATFYVRNLLIGEVDTVDLVNTGTVPVALAGTATLNPLVGGTVSVSSCSLAYVAGTCPAGATAQLLGTATGLGQRVVAVNYAATLPVGGAVHLRVTLAGVLYQEATLTATPTAVRAAADRTAG